MYYICLEYIEIPISILTLFIRRYMSRAFQNVPPVSKPSMLADQDAWPQVHWHRVQSNWAFMYLQVEPTIKLASNVTHVSMKFKTDISWLTITQFVAAVIRCATDTLQHNLCQRPIYFRQKASTAVFATWLWKASALRLVEKASIMIAWR